MMEKKFVEMLRSKLKEQGGPKMDHQMHAKACMAKELSDLLGSDLADGVKNAKKVTIASDSVEGLKKGAEMVDEALEGEEREEMEDSENEMEESDEMEDSMDMQDEEDKIAELEKKLAELKSKKKR